MPDAPEPEVEESEEAIDPAEAARLAAVIREEVGEEGWHALVLLSRGQLMLRGGVGLLALGILVTLGKLALWALVAAGSRSFGATPPEAPLRVVLIGLGVAVLLAVLLLAILTPLEMGIARRLQPLVDRGYDIGQLWRALPPRLGKGRRDRAEEEREAIAADPALARWVRARRVLSILAFVVLAATVFLGAVRFGDPERSTSEWAWALLDPEDEVGRWFWRVLLGGLAPVAAALGLVHWHIRRAVSCARRRRR